MKPSLLLYCQHSLGIGHLTRSFAIADALTADFRVVFLNGGPLPSGTRVPAGVEIVSLPPLGMDEGHGLVSRGTLPLTEAKRRRGQAVLGVLRALRPAVLLVELFPFGRKKFAFELLPLLKAARRMAPRAPVVVCSLRDILVGGRADQDHYDERARWITDRYFDLVLVHADPAFARLEESFRPRRPLRTPVRYTGFVVPERDAVEAPRRGSYVLVSAGGGAVGRPLFAAALEAQALLASRPRRTMRLIAGPLLPEAEWQALRDASVGRGGVDLRRSVPDMGAELRSAGLSVSQCGYNTALEIARSGAPALVVPYGDGGEDEQMNRARRLENLGVLRVLAPSELTGARLAAEIVALAEFRPRPAALDCGGAGHTAAILTEMLRARGPVALGAGVGRPA